MLNHEYFEKCLKNRKNIKFLLIDKIFIKSHFDNLDKEKMNKLDIKSLFNKIREIIKLIEIDNIIFVVFYEYFFNRNVLSYEQKDNIINTLIKIMSDINNAFFLLPFLYENKSGPDEEELKDIINYCADVDVDYRKHPSVFWKVTDYANYEKEKTKWFSNEVFVIFNGNIILSHKKGSYCNEVMKEVFKKYNFYYGIGKNKILATNEGDKKIADIFEKYIYIGICKEVVDEIDYIKYYFNKFDSNILCKDLKKIVENKQQLFKKLNGQLYRDKTYFIIISNTMNLNKIIHTFPDGSIVIQSDPNNSQVLEIQYSQNIISKLEKMNFSKDFSEEKDINIFREIIERNLFNVTKKINCVNVTNYENLYLIEMFNIN